MKPQLQCTFTSQTNTITLKGDNPSAMYSIAKSKLRGTVTLSEMIATTTTLNSKLKALFQKLTKTQTK